MRIKFLFSFSCFRESTHSTYKASQKQLLVCKTNPNHKQKEDKEKRDIEGEEKKEPDREERQREREKRTELDGQREKRRETREREKRRETPEREKHKGEAGKGI